MVWKSAAATAHHHTTFQETALRVERDQRATDTREKIILSAADVFDTRGYIGAGMAEIIAGTGMTRGAVYFHFTAKAEIASTIIERQRRTWQPLVDDANARSLQGLDAIYFLIDSVSKQMADDVVARAAIRLAREADLIDGSVRSPFSDWCDCFSYNLRQAQLLGQMRPELDPVTYAEILVGMFLGVEEFSRSSANPLNQPRETPILNSTHFSLDAMWEMVLRGLAVEPRTH